MPKSDFEYQVVWNLKRGAVLQAAAIVLANLERIEPEEKNMPREGREARAAGITIRLLDELTPQLAEYLKRNNEA